MCRFGFYVPSDSVSDPNLSVYVIGSLVIYHCFKKTSCYQTGISVVFIGETIFNLIDIWISIRYS